MTQHDFVKKKREAVLHGGSLIILLLCDGVSYGFPNICLRFSLALYERVYVRGIHSAQSAGKTSDPAANE